MGKHGKMRSWSKTISPKLFQYLCISNDHIFYNNLNHKSDIVCSDENQCAYRQTGYTCVKRLRKYGVPVGSLQKTFENHGRVNLIFKNCNDHGFVKVLLNDIPIKAIERPDEAEFFESDEHYGNDTRESVGKTKTEANFVVKPGDVLTLKEEDGAAIKVVSLTIGRGKKISCSISYDQNVVKESRSLMSHYKKSKSK